MYYVGLKRKCHFIVFHLQDNSYGTLCVYFVFDNLSRVPFRKHFCEREYLRKRTFFSTLAATILTIGTARDLRDALAGLCSAAGSPLAGRFLESGGATATRGAGSADGTGSALNIERFTSKNDIKNARKKNIFGTWCWCLEIRILYLYEPKLYMKLKANFLVEEHQ
jgi:hypothetical protein